MVKRVTQKHAAWEWLRGEISRRGGKRTFHEFCKLGERQGFASIDVIKARNYGAQTGQLYWDGDSNAWAVTESLATTIAQSLKGP